MQMIKRKSIIVFLSVLAVSIAYADCPPTNQVKYGCSSIFGQKHCNWSAPWYEGFPEDGAQPNQEAQAFTKAYWGTTNNEPKPGDIGTSICFYASPQGKEIELVQNRWGGIEYPTGQQWTNGEWQGHPGRVCGNGLSQSECGFNYP